MKKYTHYILVIAIGIVAILLYFISTTVRQEEILPEQLMVNERDELISQMMQEMSPETDESEVPLTGDQLVEFMKKSFQYSGKLFDITEGKKIREISTQGNATGTASMSYENGEFAVLASFGNLPEPEDDDFYEGWVVRKSPFSFISTGKAVNEEGIYINSYSSEVDYTDHNFYVLTLEPNDGDPAPADHILEGTLNPLN